MIVVSIHGLSGQGVDKALEVLSKAAASSAMQTQALFFASDEKRGAPVWGQVKMDKSPIISKQTESADYCLVFDASIDEKHALAGVKDGGSIILNTAEKVDPRNMRKRKIKTFSLDATAIAVAAAGNHKPNMAMLGALAKNFNKISMKSVKSAAEHMAKENLIAIDEGYKNIKMVK